MKRATAWSSIAAACAASVVIAACGRPTAPVRRGARPLRDVTYERTAARRERGRYLAEGVMQCFLCHSDRDWSQPGAPPIASRKGGGHVWEDRPWLVAPNLTPDVETGAGAWTDDMLGRAIREGIGHDGRVLHGQMWYSAFRSLSDEDLASVIVYLRSIPAVRNPLPRTTLPDGKPLVAPEPIAAPVPRPASVDPVKRGAYLVAIADCAGCHTAWEAPMNPGYFGGGNRIVLGAAPAVFSANITSSPSGIPYYDDALFREVIRNGRQRGRTLSSVMPWTVFQHMSDDDLSDVFAYLRSRRPVPHNVDNQTDRSTCPACGQAHGLGDRNAAKLAHAVTVDGDLLASYAGEYAFDESHFRATITADRGRLFVRFDDDKDVSELKALSANEFTAEAIPDVFSFIRNSHGRVTGVTTNADEVGRRIR